MTTLTWYTSATQPQWFKLRDDSVAARTERYWFRIRPTNNGRFALAVTDLTMGGPIHAKRYVSLHGAQTAAQRWLDKQQQAVRV